AGPPLVGGQGYGDVVVHLSMSMVTADLGPEVPGRVVRVREPDDGGRGLGDVVEIVQVGDKVTARNAVARGRGRAVELAVQRVAREVLDAGRKDDAGRVGDNLEEAAEQAARVDRATGRRHDIQTDRLVAGARAGRDGDRVDDVLAQRPGPLVV